MHLNLLLIGFLKLARIMLYVDRPLLSRGSPSQLTLLVNAHCSQVYTANHDYCDWRFFFLETNNIHVVTWLIGFS